MLDVDVNETVGAVAVTVVRLDGELDASNYNSLIEQTQGLYDSGARDLLLDMQNLAFVSSSGLVALHRMALIMRGETLEEVEEGWNAFHGISRDIDQAEGPEKHFKLLKPQPTVRKVLDTAGFSEIMPIFEDEKTAVTSYG